MELECVYLNTKDFDFPKQSDSVRNILEQVVEKTILTDTEKISEISNEINQIPVGSTGILIFDIKNFTTHPNRHSHDIYINVFITRETSSKNYKLDLTASDHVISNNLSVLDDLKQTLIKSFDRNSNVKINQQPYEPQLCISYLANALKKIEAFINKNTGSYDVSKHDAIIVDVGLKEMRTKDLLELVLNSLNFVLELKKDFVLSDPSLKLLINVLTDLNFRPSDNESKDMRLQALRYLCRLKENGQKFPDDFNLKTYFDRNRLEFRTRLGDLKEKLDRNENSKGCWNMFINQRSEFISIVWELDSCRVTVDDLRPIFIYFDPDLNFSSHVEKIIKILSQILSDSDSLEETLIDKAFEITRTSQSPDINVAFLNILSKLSSLNSISKLDLFLSKTIPKVSIDNLNTVYTLSQRLNVEDHLSLRQYMYEVLICSEVSESVQKATSVLKKYQKRNDHVQHLVQIEEKIIGRSLDEGILKELLELVENGQRISMNCFRILSRNFSSSCTCSIIGKIVENNLQSIPEFLVNEFKKFVRNNTKDESAIEMIFKLSISLLTVSDLKVDILMTDKIKQVIKKDSRLVRMFIKMVDVEKRRNGQISNELALFLETLMPRLKQDIEILTNPRVELTTRKKALEKIMAIEPNEVKTFHLKALQNIIIGEPELRDESFMVLVKILPRGFSKMFSPDWNEIATSMSHFKQLDLITEIFDKDPQDDLTPFSDILFNLFRESQTNRNQILTLLNNLAKNSGNTWVASQVDNFLNLIPYCDQDQQKKSLIDLIKRNKIPPKEILKHVSIEFSDDLRNLFYIAPNYSSDQFLIDLYSSNESDFESLIEGLNIQDDYLTAEVFLNVFKKQTISTSMVNKFLTFMRKREHVLALGIIKQILCYLMLKNVSFNEDFIWKSLSLSDVFDDYSVFMVRLLVIQGKRLPDEVLSKLFSVIDSGPIETAILSVNVIQLLINNNRMSNPRAIEVLKNVCLKTSHETDEIKLVLNLQALKCLQKLKFGPGSIKFLADLYISFKQRFLNEDEFDKLDAYFESTGITYEDKLYLLYLLNRMFLRLRTIDFNLFRNFDRKEWVKEILCKEFITQIASDHVVNEYELGQFKQKIDSLNSPSYSIQDLFEKLIEIQMRYEYDLTDLNIILSLFNKQRGLLRLLDSDSNFDISIRHVLVEEGLITSSIKVYSKDDIKQMVDCLDLKLELLDKVVSNIPIKSEIKDILKFCSKFRETSYKSYFVQHYTDKETSLDEWLKSLNLILIEEMLQNKYNTDHSKWYKRFRERLFGLFSIGWRMSGIKKLIDLGSDEFKDLVLSLDTVIEFGLREYETDSEDRTVLDIYYDSKPAKWHKQINNLAMFRTFEGSYDKNKIQLIDEIKQLNGSGLSILRDSKLLEKFDQVCKAYESCKDWDRDEIEKWADEVKKNPSSVGLDQKIGVLNRAVEICYDYKPRDVQILSLIILLETESNKGRLAQINTGEGKTIVVGMLAAIKALDGHKVDVITSSTELAEPQSKHLAKLYDCFGLSVSHNSPNEAKDIKQRYTADVVYGNAGNFQGDILRDEFSKLGTRNKRKCDVAIVDEVDSMLIDEKNNIVMLSSPMPGMEHLQPLLAAIWVQVESIGNFICERDGKTYLIKTSDVLNNTGDIEKKIFEKLLPLKGSKEEFIQKCTEEHLKKLISNDGKSSKNHPKINIPSHLRDLVSNGHLKKWIDSAICAKYKYKLNQHYIINDEKIFPVDSSNTGVVQQNMHWNNALHQFLQFKHGAKITPESLTTNFISNVTFFRRYGSNIFGLTGTLGSENARDLLSKTYNVDHVIIPPFRKKQYKELRPIIVRDEKKWYQNIVESSINKLKIGRAVLIITRYISEVEEIYKILRKKFKYDTTKIKLYKTNADSKVIHEEIKPGEIIIATNIAGRGTDIKADKVEINGGLHVCVTFLPLNKRVEQQNVGRTSRTGFKGTAQFIILNESKKERDIHSLRNKRDIDEVNDLKNAENVVKSVTLKDRIFEKFCKLLDNFKETEENSKFMKINRKAVEERFGIWMKMKENANELKDEDKAFDLFEIFKEEILNDQDNVIKNPFFHVLLGNQYLHDEEYEKSIDEYSKAIELDKHYSAFAYYYRGYARVKKYGKEKYLGLVNKNDKEKKQTEESIKDFKEAKKLIDENFEPLLYLNLRASYSECVLEQVMHKLTLYFVLKNSIETALGVGQEGFEKRLKLLNETKKIIEEKLASKAEFERKRNALKEYIKILKIKKSIFKDPLPINRMFYVESCELQNSYLFGGCVTTISNEAKNKIEDMLFSRNQSKGCSLTELAEDYIREKLKSIGIEDESFIKSVLELDYYDQILVIKFINNQLEKDKNEIKAIENCIDKLNEERKSIENGVIQDALDKEEGIEIKLEEIGKSLPQDQNLSLYQLEIDEFKNSGFLGSIEIAKKKPIDWWSVIGVTLLGLIQIGIGAALIIFSSGMLTSLGTGLVIEGISDLITAVERGIIKRDFSWKEYGIEKAISLTVTIVCAGLGEIKIAYKILASGVKQVVLRQAMNALVKEGWKLAAKKVGLMITKKVITKVLVQKISEALMKSIKNELIKRSKGPIKRSLESNKQVLKMLELDGNNRDCFYQSKIRFKALEIMNPINKSDHPLTRIAIGISSGIAKSKIEYLSEIMQVKEALEALEKLVEYLPEFLGALKQKIDEIFKEIKEEKRQKRMKQKELQIKLKRDRSDSSDLTNKLAETISSNMCAIIQCKIVNPALDFTANWAVNQAMSNFEQKIDDEIDLYKSERRIEFMQDGDKDNRVPDEFKQGHLDQKAINKADEIIKDLKAGGEAGLIHIGALSDEIDRPIHIYDENNNLLRTIGDDKNGEPVKIEYHSSPTGKGHYTLSGGIEIKSDNSNSNNCLFNVIAYQCNKDPKELRQRTVERMEMNKEHLADQVYDIEKLEHFKQNALFLGGQKLNLYGTELRRFEIRIAKDIEKYEEEDKENPKDPILIKNGDSFIYYDLKTENNESERNEKGEDLDLRLRKDLDIPTAINETLNVVKKVLKKEDVLKKLTPKEKDELFKALELKNFETTQVNYIESRYICNGNLGIKKVPVEMELKTNNVTVILSMDKNPNDNGPLASHIGYIIAIKSGVNHSGHVFVPHKILPSTRVRESEHELPEKYSPLILDRDFKIIQNKTAIKQLEWRRQNMNESKQYLKN